MKELCCMQIIGCNTAPSVAVWIVLQIFPGRAVKENVARLYAVNLDAFHPLQSRTVSIFHRGRSRYERFGFRTRLYRAVLKPKRPAPCHLLRRLVPLPVRRVLHTRAPLTVSSPSRLTTEHTPDLFFDVSVRCEAFSTLVIDFQFQDCKSLSTDGPCMIAFRPS